MVTHMSETSTTTRRKGKRSFAFPGLPAVLSTFSISGPMEGKGPLKEGFDTIMPDTFYGEKSWEKTESKMLQEAITYCIKRANAQDSDIDLLFTGDLLNQNIGGSFAAKDLTMSHLGVYSACASFGEGLILAAMSLEGGFADHTVVGVSSHHDSVERQFRFPTELGVQRPPTAQWTATIAAATLLGYAGGSVGSGNASIRLVGATVGQVIEMGLKDPFDMGSAMAPAAVDTLATHFKDFGVSPSYYDLIITGDLGLIGRELAADMLESKGLAVRSRLNDCGLLLYDRKKQDVHAGGSGTACSGGVFCAYIAKGMEQGKWKRVLLAPTGSLHSPTTYKQGECIPAVCHAVALEVVG